MNNKAELRKKQRSYVPYPERRNLVNMLTEILALYPRKENIIHAARKECVPSCKRIKVTQYRIYWNTGKPVLRDNSALSDRLKNTHRSYVSSTRLMLIPVTWLIKQLGLRPNPKHIKALFAYSKLMEGKNAVLQ